MSANYCSRAGHGTMRRQKGFSMIELMVVVFIGMVAAAMAIPGYTSMTRYLRIAGDARDINGAIGQAKMRAAQDFTHARVFVDLTNNTFRIERWNKTSATTGCWKPDSDNLNTCPAATNPVQQLSQGVTFGFGAVGTPPPNTQAAIAQALPCGTLAAGIAGNATTPGTACVEFNSRGIPVDPTVNGAPPTPADAFYLTDGTMVYGVTVNQGGLLQDWATAIKSVTWTHR